MLTIKGIKEDRELSKKAGTWLHVRGDSQIDFLLGQVDILNKKIHASGNNTQEIIANEIINARHRVASKCRKIALEVAENWVGNLEESGSMAAENVANDIMEHFKLEDV